ncbi:MAG: STAS domain-containing protein [Firmicutes bacterium]|nr:STAS domain-containing protein [Bacillota bacterium]
MFEIKVMDGGDRVAVSGSLTIACLSDFYQDLTRIFNDGICTVLDCTGVVEIDTASVQTLMAFKKLSSELNRPVEFLMSDAMQETLSLLGLKKFFKTA